MVTVARPQRRYVHLTHWGAAEIESDGRQLTSVRPWREDPAPSRILENLASDVFVPVSWEAALDLQATELRRVYGRYGPDGVYGGSYGWASAGRFRHAQSQRATCAVTATGCRRPRRGRPP